MHILVCEIEQFRLLLYEIRVKLGEAQEKHRAQIDEKQGAEQYFPSLMIAVRHLLQLLHVIELLVVAVQGDELLVTPPLHNHSVLHNADFVGVLDGRQTVGDCNGRA